MEDYGFDPCISIIIPCYNVEKTLERCLDSVLNQSFSCFEILLVDDGSEDHTADIAGRYCEKDRRLILISETHRGVSAARNTGLQNVKASWVCFMDADDVLPPESLEYRVHSLREYPEADLVIGCFETNDSRLYTGGGPEGICQTEDFKEHFSQHMISIYYGVVWNKLYRTRIIKENALTFPEGIRWSEDMLFNLEYMEKCRMICYLNRKIYYYDYCSKPVKNDYSVYWKTQVMRLEKIRRFLNTDKLDADGNETVLNRFLRFFYCVMNTELSMAVGQECSIKQKWNRFYEILKESRYLCTGVCKYDFHCENGTWNLLHILLKRGYEKRLFVFYMVKSFFREFPVISRLLDKRKHGASFE